MSQVTCLVETGLVVMQSVPGNEHALTGQMSSMINVFASDRVDNREINVDPIATPFKSTQLDLKNHNPATGANEEISTHK